MDIVRRNIRKKQFAFIVNCRLDSRRIHDKALKKINGIPLIEHLIIRLIKCDIPVILCPTNKDLDRLWYLRAKYGIQFFSGYDDDPLARMLFACERYGVHYGIRVCTDKIFIIEDDVDRAIKKTVEQKPDYLFVSGNADGNRFEIIKKEALARAFELYKNVEHISYAVRSVSKKTTSIETSRTGSHRLLIDYPEDLQLMELIFSLRGNECTIEDADRFLFRQKQYREINTLPLVSIYTCAKNSEEFIYHCMESVKNQSIRGNIEYILIDDFSDDYTFLGMNMFCLENKWARCFRNEKNIGLSSSSNRALLNARGKYIIRLDSDDKFSSFDAIQNMVDKMEKDDLEAVYPNNYFGTFSTIQKGNEKHHIGGTLFQTRALNHIKFTEGLKKGDSYDVYERCKDILKLGYIDKPLFFYTQREGSLSRS